MLYYRVQSADPRLQLRYQLPEPHAASASHTALPRCEHDGLDPRHAATCRSIQIIIPGVSFEASRSLGRDACFSGRPRTRGNLAVIQAKRGTPPDVVRNDKFGAGTRAAGAEQAGAHCFVVT